MEILRQGIWKLPIFMCFIIVTSLVSMTLVSVPVHAGSTVLSASIIVDDNLIPSSTFSIDVNITDVENLWGYSFRLYYNTAVLYATSASFNSPFTNKWYNLINHTAGFVYLSYSMPMGTIIGFSTNETYPTWAIAKIDFLVIGLGTSWLDISDDKLSDPMGGKIAHTVVDGYFSNIGPAEETEKLIETTETWNLPKGIEKSLTSKLDGVIRLLNKGNENGAVHKLAYFIKHVEALRNKKLADEQADYLIGEAQRIISLIEE